MTDMVTEEVITADDAARVAAVRRYAILDTPPDDAFDRITALAARLLRAPIALVSIVDTDRIWFKSHHGVDVEEVGRDPGFCATAILQHEPWLVNDASVDPRAMANPLVTGELGLRFYAGAPLTTPDGYNLGTLCVIDMHPRQLTDEELDTLSNLAAIVMDELELRRSARLTARRSEALKRSAELRFRHGFETSPVGMALLDLRGRFLIANPAVCQMLGRTEATLQQMSAAELTDPRRWDGGSGQIGRMLCGELPFCRIETRCFRPDGEAVWALVVLSLVRDASGDPDYLFLQLQDVTARKRAEDELNARVAQQAAVTELGRRSADGIDDEALIAHAVDAVGTGLDGASAALFELRDSHIALAAARGCWGEQVAPGQTPPGADSQVRYTVRSAEAVKVDDLRTETRFEPPALLMEKGLVSSISVAITVSGQDYGVLAAYSPQIARFSSDDANFMQAVANVVGMTIERRRQAETQALIQRHAQLGTWEVDVATGATRWSDELYRLLGHEPGQAELAGEGTLSAVDCGSREQAEQMMRLLRESHQPVEFTHQIVRPDGETRWIYARSEVVVSADGVPLKFWGTVLDITDLKKAEEGLRAAELKFLAGFESSPVGMSLQSTAGRFLRVNPALCGMLGRSEAELQQMTLADVCHPAVVDENVAAMTAMLKGETESVQAETRWLRSDGEVAWLLMNVSLVRGVNGDPDYFYSQVQDITRTRRGERRTRSLAELRRKALVGMSVELLTDDAVRGVTSALNLECATVHTVKGSADVSLVASYGCPADSVGAEQADEDGRSQVLYTIQTDEAVLVTDLANEERFVADPRLVDRGLVSAVSVVITVRGQPYGVLAAYSIRSQTFSSGDVAFVQAVADVLGRAIEQREHENDQERLHQRERLVAVGQLAAGVAHDFNNILSAISLYIALLEDNQRFDDTGQAHLGAVRQQVERATALVWQVLDFAHRSPLDLVDVELSSFLGGIRPLMQRVMTHGVDVTVVDRGGPFVVRGDPTRLQQIFLNLATNAHDAFDGPGQLTITLSVDQAPAGADPGTGEWVRADVVDTGRGMSPEVLARVFEPFFTTKPTGSGTGLGLSQVHGLVSQHGGHISIQSSPDHGTSVSIWLQRVEPVKTVDAPSEVEVPRGRGERLAVVDDDPAVRAALGQVLESLGYVVTLAADGREALHILEQHSDSVRALVTDVRMPDIRGDELAHLVTERWPDLPIVLISGYPALNPHGDGERPDAAPRDTSCGGRVVRLAKPFTREVLAETLSGALR